MRDEEKAVQHLLRGKEIQMQEISAVYKSCAEENDRLHRKVNELKTGETSQYQNYKECESELIAARYERDQYANKQRSLLEEIGTLEQHVQYLNKELEKANSNFNSAKNQTLKLSEQQKNIKNMSHIMETNQDDIRKKLASVSQENVNSFDS